MGLCYVFGWYLIMQLCIASSSSRTQCHFPNGTNIPRWSSVYPSTRVVAHPPKVSHKSFVNPRYTITHLSTSQCTCPGFWVNCERTPMGYAVSGHDKIGLRQNCPTSRGVIFLWPTPYLAKLYLLILYPTFILSDYTDLFSGVCITNVCC
jgi:hypothetical protein